MNEIFHFDRARVVHEPFPHFTAPQFMDQTAADRLLDWFEREAPWSRQASKGFYDSYDISLAKTEPPPDLGFLTDRPFLEAVRDQVAELMRARLGPRIEVAAHKLVPGFHIGVHSDFGVTGETQRLLVQLNRGWAQQNGGILMLLREEHPTELSEHDRCYVPVHRSAMSFEVSARSYHAVSTVESGDRYTLCISFYG